MTQETDCTIYSIDEQGLVEITDATIEWLEALDYSPTDDRRPLLGWPHAAMRRWTSPYCPDLWVGEEEVS